MATKPKGVAALVTVPNTDTLQREIEPLVSRANAMVVKTVEEAQNAAAERQVLKQMRTRIETECAPAIEAAHAAHKEALALKNRMLAPVDAADAVLKSRMLIFNAEQDHIRQEAQRKAEEEAQREAEERRQEELAALEAERKREKADRDALLAAGREEEARLADLRRAEVAAQARELKAAPVVAAPVVVEAVKIAGQRESKVWKARVIDAAKIPVEHYAAFLGRSPTVLKAFEQHMVAYAKQFAGVSLVPGVQFYQEAQIAVLR